MNEKVISWIHLVLGRLDVSLLEVSLVALYVVGQPQVDLGGHHHGPTADGGSKKRDKRCQKLNFEGFVNETNPPKKELGDGAKPYSPFSFITDGCALDTIFTCISRYHIHFDDFST